MEQTQKKLTKAFNEFINVLVEEELEPLHLDMIRIENDLREEIKIVVEHAKSSIYEEMNKKIISLENSISELKNIDMGDHESQSLREEKFNSLKSSIDNLASKVSEVFDVKGN